MKKGLIVLACLLWNLILSGQTTWAFQQQDKSKQQSDQIQQLLESYAKLQQFSGAALVAENGEVIFSGGFGFANRELEVPASAEHRFIIGSMTKAFTSVLVMQSVEAGKLELEAPVKKYWPEFTDPTGGKITIDHLLKHQSGLNHWNAIDGFLQNQAKLVHDHQQLANMFAETGTRFEPGTQFGYSSPGYYILGIVLTKVWNKDFDDLIAERIFEPAGMNASAMHDHASIVPARASAYRYNFVKARYDNAEYRDPTTLYSTGGILSTVEDLLKWDQALYGNKLLSEESRMTIFDSSNGRQAFGWHNQFPGREGERIAWHGGQVTGYRSQITRCLDTKRTVILLGNLRDINTQAITSGVLDILDGKTPPSPRHSLMKAVLEKVANESVNAAIAHFDSIRQEDNGTYHNDPTQLLLAAVELRSDAEYASAKGLYEHWIKSYPDSPYQQMAQQHLADCKRMLDNEPNGNAGDSDDDN